MEASADIAKGSAGREGQGEKEAKEEEEGGGVGVVLDGEAANLATAGADEGEGFWGGEEGEGGEEDDVL